MDNLAEVLHCILCFLSIAPCGLSGKLLFDVLIEQGFNQDIIAKAMRICLDKGSIKLNSEMRLCINNDPNAG